MCLDCARRRLRQLRHTHPFSEGAGWFMCIVDHDDHIHVRINAQDEEGEDAAAEWIQIPASLDVFQVALREMNVSHRRHLHAMEPAKKGCSDEVVQLIPHVVFDATAAADASSEGFSLEFLLSHRNDVFIRKRNVFFSHTAMMSSSVAL